jgi:hypothetical protein
LIVVSVLLASAESIYELSKCNSFRGNWDRSIKGRKCVDPQVGIHFFMAQSGKRCILKSLHPGSD